MSVLLQEPHVLIEPSIEPDSYLLPGVDSITIRMRKTVASWVMCLSVAALAISVVVIVWTIIGGLYDSAPEPIFLQVCVIVSPIALVLLWGSARFDRKTGQMV